MLPSLPEVKSHVFEGIGLGQKRLKKAYFGPYFGPVLGGFGLGLGFGCLLCRSYPVWTSLGV